MSDAKPGALSTKTIVIAMALGAIAALLVSTVILTQKRGPQENAGSSETQLVDGGKQIGMDASGKLLGVTPMPAEDASLLEQVLRERKLPFTLKPVVLPKDAKVFAALAPLGEKTSNMPTFIWRQLDGAKSYRVQVQDASGQTVAASERVAGTQWTIGKPLPELGEFSWSVQAETVAGPVEAQPVEKRFVTMGAGDLASVREARSHGLHLLTAAVFAKLGLRSEAALELQQLEAENANSALLRDLRASLHLAQ